MPIIVVCPQCAARMKIASDLVGSGKSVRCAKCQAKVPVPKADSAMPISVPSKPPERKPSSVAATAAAPAPKKRAGSPSRENEAWENSRLLAEDEWILRMHENILFKGWQALRFHFLRPESEEVLGAMVESSSWSTKILRMIFAFARPYLPTRYEVRDGAALLFTIEASGGKSSRRITVRSSDGAHLWFSEVNPYDLAQVPMLQEDGEPIAMLADNRVSSNNNEKLGMIAHELSPQSTGRSYRPKFKSVEFMPKTRDGAFVCSDTDDLSDRVLVLSAACARLAAKQYVSRYVTKR